MKDTGFRDSELYLLHEITTRLYIGRFPSGIVTGKTRIMEIS